MLRKFGLIVSLLAVLTMGADSPPSKLVRLTISNKSGLPIEISFTGQTWEIFYYLRIPSGTRHNPTIQTFSVVPDTYASTLYYVELWDPVYGYSCSDQSDTLDIHRNIRVTVVECDVTPRRSEEPPAIIKYGSDSRPSQSQASSPTLGSLTQSLIGRRILSGRYSYLSRIE